MCTFAMLKFARTIMRKWSKLAFARGQLADFKVPQFVSVRSEPLPRNPGGKVLKPSLRQGTDWQPVR